MMTRDEINAHYALLAAEYGITYYPTNKSGRLELKQDSVFLTEMMPRFEFMREDTGNLLTSIIRGTTEADIRWILDLQKRIEGTTYRDIQSFLESFSLYIGKGLIRKPKRVQSDPAKLIALYNITIAVLDIQTDYHRGDALHPLVQRTSNQGYVYYINHKELIALVIDHPEHCDEIEEAIRQQGYVHMPSIHHVINGETKSVAAGVL